MNTTTTFRPAARHRSRRGTTLVLMALLLVVFVGLTAFAVDLGIIFLERAQMQNAADSGAIAATLALANDPDDLVGAKAEAEKFIRLNRVGMMVTVPEDAIVADIGKWDDEAGVFSATTDEPNAVRVTARQSNERFFFGQIFGQTVFGVPGQAVASGNGSPLDIMMVLDLSGSMEDEGRIEALQNSAPTFVDVIEELGGADRIGVMGLSADPSGYDPVDEGHAGSLYMAAGTPSDDHHVGVLEANLTGNFDDLRSNALSSNTLEAWRYTGWTGTGAAIRDAAHYLAHVSYARENAIRVIVLMSDGDANKPRNNGPSYARQMATYAAGLDVIIYTISLGNDAKLDLMQDIADTTGGEHFDATGSGESQLTSKLTEAFEKAARAAKRTTLVQ